MSKKLEDIQKRHSLVKNLITNQTVSNQAQLQKMLKQNNVKVTQATLSRDLNELGIVRIPGPDGFHYKISAVGDEYALRSRISEEIISLEANENLIVIRTFPGRAQGVALFIDKQNRNDILGSLAGDDTIMIAPKSVKQIKSILEKVKTMLGIK
jgi:transcriptional regulator of arginine metabolism